MDEKEVKPIWALTHDEAQSEVQRLRFALDEEETKTALLQIEINSLTHYIGLLKEKYFSINCGLLERFRSHHWTLFNESEEKSDKDVIPHKDGCDGSVYVDHRYGGSNDQPGNLLEGYKEFRGFDVHCDCREIDEFWSVVNLQVLLRDRSIK